MSVEKNDESKARSEAAEARRSAYENAQIAGSRVASGGSLERRSNRDTRLITSTTPQSAIDNWGASTVPPSAPGENGDSPSPASSEEAAAATPEK
jgi:hypothetical protein